MKSISEWALERIVQAACWGARAQRTGGAMPAGHNGPYRHPETPVRNTAHWAVTFSAAWESTSDPQFKIAAHRALDYLLDEFQSTGRTAFICRHARGKDRTNGVIGQAWAIEGLVEAGLRTGREDALQAASLAFSNHSYDCRARAWRKVVPGAGAGDFDWTFNHQLWLCASGALLVQAGYPAATDSVEDFTSDLGTRVAIYPDGLIRHANTAFIKARGGATIKSLARSAYCGLFRRQMLTKSVGYHCFNTYAIALIAKSLDRPELCRLGSCRAAFDFIASPQFWDAIESNPFGFPYNPPGLEAAFSLRTAHPADDSQPKRWLAREARRSGNSAYPFFTTDTADPQTSRARIYELTRLLD